MKMDISNEELIAAMQNAVNSLDTEVGDDPGLTRDEWSEVWGLSNLATLQGLRMLGDAGKLVVGKRAGMSVNLRRIRRDVYSVKIA